MPVNVVRLLSGNLSLLEAFTESRERRRGGQGKGAEEGRDGGVVLERLL